VEDRRRAVGWISKSVRARFRLPYAMLENNFGTEDRKGHEEIFFVRLLRDLCVLLFNPLKSRLTTMVAR
jgi:hypothetical protein